MIPTVASCDLIFCSSVSFVMRFKWYQTPRHGSPQKLWGQPTFETFEITRRFSLMQSHFPADAYLDGLEGCNGRTGTCDARFPGAHSDFIIGFDGYDDTRNCRTYGMQPERNCRS